MKRMHQYGLILLAGVAYAALFNDYTLAIIITVIVLGITLTLDGIRDFKQRRNEQMDRPAMMKEITAAAKKFQEEGKANTHGEALKMVKTTGLWAQITEKFKTKTPETKTFTEPTLNVKIEAPPELPTVGQVTQIKAKTTKQNVKTKMTTNKWTFDEEEPATTSDLPVEAINEKGHEYVALVHKILDEGTNNWNTRLDDLQHLQDDMRQILNDLQPCWEEIRAEKKLVSDLARIKRREQLE